VKGKNDEVRERMKESVRYVSCDTTGNYATPLPSEGVTANTTACNIKVQRP
jgi:hypothetical protein